jgi:hypothetical protein
MLLALSYMQFFLVLIYAIAGLYAERQLSSLSSFLPPPPKMTWQLLLTNPYCTCSNTCLKHDVSRLILIPRYILKTGTISDRRDYFLYKCYIYDRVRAMHAHLKRARHGLYYFHAAYAGHTPQAMHIFSVTTRGRL